MAGPINQFDAPIPGQSLTDSPGNAPWENPPQFAKLDEAADYVFKQLINPRNLKLTLAYLDKGVPFEMLADIIVFTGFQSGKWTVDVGQLLKPAVMHMLMGLARSAGVAGKTKLYYKDRGITDELINLEKIDFSKMQNGVSSNKAKTPATPLPGAGFMDKPEGLM